MSDRFDYFVVFAEMRTGSNFLEANLNAFEGLTCHGEAFNPHFIGYPQTRDILGISQLERDADPYALLTQIRNTQEPGLSGFRFFHDHDPRVLPQMLEDPRCAKIVLTRNPLDSYVSWKIAQATGQWKLTNVKRRREAKASFDADEFQRHLAALQAFQVTLMKAMQTSGQTAFYLAYEDLQDVQVMNGLANWLGCTDRRDRLNSALKRQNPAPVEDKVVNPDVMRAALARVDTFNLTRTPGFEPRRGPVVPSYTAAHRTPLLYLPIRSGPETAVCRWLAALDDVAPDDLPGRFTQKSLRQWKRERPGHRSFSVLRHPVVRAHDVFCRRILNTGSGSYAQIRRTLIRTHELPLPQDGPDDSYDAGAHRSAFTAFLRFLKANLNGQTAVRVDGHWASQALCLQGMAEFALPDMLIREAEMATYLPALAMQVGHPNPPDPDIVPTQAPFSLAEIYDDEIESLARDAYQRDYLMFGFEDWG